MSRRGGIPAVHGREEVKDSFPRRQARTRRFTLGTPRGVALSPDGTRVTFLRSRGGTDAVTCLWSLDVATGAGAPGRRPAHPRGRQRRGPAARGAGPARAGARAGGRHRRLRHRPGRERLAAFALSGRPHVVDLLPGGAPPRPLDAPGPVVDPRPDPTGSRVAYVSGGALHVHDLAAGTTDRRRRARVGHRHLRSRRLRRGRGDEPHAGLLVVPGRRIAAGRAGRRRARPPLAHRRPGQPRARAHGRRLPRRGHAERAGLAGRRRARRHPGRRRVGRRPGRVPRARRVVRRRAADRRAAPRPARVARPARRPGHRGDRASCTRTRTRTGSRSSPACPARTASGALLWITDDGDRAPPARRRRAGHPAVAAGPRRARRRRRHGAVQRLGRPGRRSRCGPGPRPTGCAASPRSRGCTAGGWPAGPSSWPRQSLDADGTVTTVRPAGGSRADDRLVRRAARAGARGSPCTPPASGRCGPRCCCRRGTGRERRCRCSWTPTAARTPSASSPPAART